MTIEIDDSYILWLRTVVFASNDVAVEDVAAYVNGVLASHKTSWEESNAED